MEFKVGDRVKVVDVDNEITDRKYWGKTGEIVSIDGRTFPYRVDFGGKNHIFSAKCLQKVESERELKVGDRVNWTCEGYSGTGVIVKRNDSDRYQWSVKRDTTGWPLNDVLMLRTSDIALIDSVIKVGDVVKIARPDNATDNQFVGKIGKVIKIIEKMTYPVLVDTGESERWYSFKALEKNPVIIEYHGFSVGDVVAVKGSGFTGKIAEFSNANRPGGITVVVMNDCGERRGITTTDIEKALSHKPEEKPRLQVGDKVKVVSGGNFVGMTGTIVKDDRSDVPFFVELPNGRERWFIERNLEKVEDVKPESTRLKVGDRVRVVKDKYDDRFVGKTGKIEKDDQTKAPFLMRFDDGDVSIGNNGTRWFYVDELVKIEDVKPVENKIKVGDTVKVVRDRSFRYGGIGVVVAKDESVVPFLVKFEDNTEYWYGTDSIGKVEGEKPKEERMFKVGDRVKIIIDVPSINKKVGVIAEDDGSSDRPLNVKDEHGNHIFWCEPEWLEKVEDVNPVERLAVGDKVRVVNCTSANYGEIGTIIKDDGSNIPFFVKFSGNVTGWYKVTSIERVEDAKPIDDWRARFEAFKASHPVGTKVKIAKKVTDDEHAELWVASMDKTVGRIGVIESYDSGNVYSIRISSCPSEFSWNYPMDALEDVTEESNQYTFTVKPSDVDLKRIWRESNPDFAVVVDMNKDSNTVFILHKGWGINDFVIDWGVRKDKVEERINQLKTAYENEKKQRIVVTIY